MIYVMRLIKTAIAILFSSLGAPGTLEFRLADPLADPLADRPEFGVPA
jgi:hypothetical protein